MGRGIPEGDGATGEALAQDWRVLGRYGTGDPRRGWSKAGEGGGRDAPKHMSFSFKFSFHQLEKLSLLSPYIINQIFNY